MVAEEMRDKLKKASQRCFDEGKMSDEEKHKYFMSGKTGNKNTHVLHRLLYPP